MNEVDKFFEDLPSQDKKAEEIFGNTPEPEKEVEEEPKNRAERRLAEKLQREREMSIALNQRVQDLAEQVKTLSEQKQYVAEHKDEIDPRLARAFGTTPEGKELTVIFQDILQETAEKAKERAMDEFEARQQQSTQAYQKKLGESENLIQSELESLEEEYGVDFTSNSASAKSNRKEFLELVEKLSPKDKDGAITDYADFQSTFELYKERKKPEPSRAKELASRSMQTSTSTGIKAPEGPMTFNRAKREIDRMFGN